MYPTISRTPAFLPAAMIACPSASESAIGFSMKTWRPACAAATAIGS